MGGNNWATPEQKQWLKAYYEEHYVPCLHNKDYMDFKPVFYTEWFKRWPEIESNEARFSPGTTHESLTKAQRDHLASCITKRQTVSDRRQYLSLVPRLTDFISHSNLSTP